LPVVNENNGNLITEPLEVLDHHESNNQEVIYNEHEAESFLVADQQATELGNMISVVNTRNLMRTNMAAIYQQKTKIEKEAQISLELIKYLFYALKK
jgi:hypothetical protein